MSTLPSFSNIIKTSIVFFGLVRVAYSQISGIIVNEQNLPLEYDTAVLYNQATGELINGTLTGVEGHFKFQNLNFGTYCL
ncbi:MAG: hypothetical protein AAF688_01935 [Bacteroidota bacterium]